MRALILLFLPTVFLSACSLAPVAKVEFAALGEGIIAKEIKSQFYNSDKLLEEGLARFIAKVPMLDKEAAKLEFSKLGMHCAVRQPICTYTAAIPHRLQMSDGTILPGNDQVKTIGIFVEVSKPEYVIEVKITNSKIN